MEHQGSYWEVALGCLGLLAVVGVVLVIIHLIFSSLIDYFGGGMKGFYSAVYTIAFVGGVVVALLKWWKES